MPLDPANKASYSVLTPPTAEDKRQGFLVSLYENRTRNVVVKATANSNLEVGVFVFNSGTDAMGKYAKLDKPTATGKNILGVSVFSRAFTLDWDEALKVHKYKQGSLMAYASTGTYYFYAEAPVDIGDKVFFRHTVNSTLNRIGAVTNATGTGLDAHPTAYFAEKITAPGLVAVTIP
jgi:hypothetical protein